MTNEQRAAYVMSQSACALIEAMGMQAENKQRETLGQSMAYDEQAFLDAITRNGIYHNAVMSTLLEH